LVGIHFAGVDGSNPPKSVSCHIHPILDVLHVTPITRAHPSAGNDAVSMLADVFLEGGARANPVPGLRNRLEESESGRVVAALIIRHRAEVLQLINHNRRAMAAWHRNQGPAFLNRVIANSRDRNERVPLEIEGCTLQSLLAAMGDVLAIEGGPELRADVRRYRTSVLAAVADVNGVHDLVDRLAEGPLIRGELTLVGGGAS
jgi:hypothetical protein